MTSNPLQDTPTRGATEGFSQLSLDKHEWRPSPLPGQIVFVSTISAQGTVDVAPKSWVSMAAFAGPVVGFGCNAQHQTFANICANGEFAINIPDTRLALRAWDLANSPRDERLQRSGLHLIEGRQIHVPLVGECVAHLECRHHQTVVFDGGEVFIFGTVVAAQIDQGCTLTDQAAGYRRLDPAFFLEDGILAALAPPTTVMRVKGQ